MFRWLKRLLDWFKGLFNGSQRQADNYRFSNSSRSLYTAPDPDTTGAVQDTEDSLLTIRIIGPRGCGKTTYLGAILACPNRSPVIKSIKAIGPESLEFEDEAINVLAEGDAFAPNLRLFSIGTLRQIKFSVAIDSGENRPPVSMTIVSRDYSGEVIDDFGIMDDKTKQMYMDDCENANGILLLLDATQHSNDFNYATSVKRFVDNLVATKADGWNGKIAIGLTKCENLEFYIERKKIGSQALIERYFPKTLNALKMSRYNQEIELGYFSMSAFGMRGRTLEENVIKKANPDPRAPDLACVWFPKIWKPFGLFAPLYWLATGDRFPPQYED